jgi:hypothetical protein
MTKRGIENMFIFYFVAPFCFWLMEFRILVLFLWDTTAILKNERGEQKG